MADGSWSDDSWKDADVRQAEEALAAAVRTADEIIADAQRAIVDAQPPADELDEQAGQDEDAEPEEEWPVLRDAW
jgi:hypothetical protein